MNINRRNIIKLFGCAALSPLSFLSKPKSKDIIYGPVEDYKELSKYWKLNTIPINPTKRYEKTFWDQGRCWCLKPVYYPGIYEIKAIYIDKEKQDLDHLIWIIEYVWDLIYDENEKDKIKNFNDRIYDYNPNTGFLQYIDVARDLSYCCHNMYGCCGKECSCKNKFFTLDKHWSYDFRAYIHEKDKPNTPEYSMKSFGFKNNLRLKYIEYQSQNKSCGFAQL